MMAAPESSRGWAVKLTLGVAIVVGMLILLRAYPPTQQSFYPKCMLHQWTGLHCAGCGGTRAVASLAHGELVQAFRFNPLLIVGTPVIALLIVFQRKREKQDGKTIPSISWLIAAVVITYSVARNVPSPTSSPLAPPAARAVETANPDQLQFGS